jgi:hypothetical protein
MSKLLMIFYTIIPDIAWGEENGESRPMGTIEGKGCIVPAVSCQKNKNARNVLDVCFNCTEFEELKSNAIKCKYDGTKKYNVEIPETEKHNKNLQNKNIKKPSGVFIP